MTDADYLKQFTDEVWLALRERGDSGLSRIQRDALCVLNFQVEVNNGGVHQYLYNSSGDFAKETPDVFRRVGANHAAKVVERANAFFGPEGPPTDREKRICMLDALSEEDQQLIHELTDDYFDAENRGQSLADLFDAYVLSQRRT